MAEPALELQRVIVAACKAAPAVAGGRVYDRVPEATAFPYLSIGDGETIGDDNDCFDSSEVFMRVHCWSREPGFVEAKTIAGLVRERMKQEFTISGFLVVNAEHVITRYLHDPDGLTAHAVVEFRYLVDHDN